MASNKKQKNKKKNGAIKPSIAEKADRHILYEQSVQCVESEIDFIDHTFQALRHRPATTLREDFCGTANTSCEWIKRRETNIAYSVDIDPDVLEWGKKNKIAKLTEDQIARINILNDNVLNVNTGPVDAVLAMNFSYWIFRDRPSMMNYFKTIRDTLVDDGVFFLDAFGGYEAFQEMEEETEHDDFSYIWDQHSYDPITGYAKCKIHFKFKDGSKIKNAFEYDWRLWTLPEIAEMLTEVGFKPTIYWEGTDKDGEGNGIFKPATSGEADAGWVTYIVAEK